MPSNILSGRRHKRNCATFSQVEKVHSFYIVTCCREQFTKVKRSPSFSFTHIIALQTRLRSDSSRMRESFPRRLSPPWDDFGNLSCAFLHFPSSLQVAARRSNLFFCGRKGKTNMIRRRVKCCNEYHSIFSGPFFILNYACEVKRRLYYTAVL